MRTRPRIWLLVVSIAALVTASCAAGTALDTAAEPTTSSSNTDQINFSLTNTFSAPLSFNESLSWVQNGNYPQLPNIAAGATGQWTVYGDPTDPQSLFEGAISFTTSAGDLVFLTWSQANRNTKPIYELYGTSAQGAAIPAIGGQVGPNTYDGTVATVAYTLVFNNDWSPPNPILSVGYDPATTGANLSWVWPSNSQPVVGFDVFEDNGVHLALQSQVPADQTVLSIPNLDPGLTYRFVVKAIGSQGSPAPSNSVALTIPGG